MPTYYINFYEFADITFTGGAGNTTITTGVSGGLTVDGGASPLLLVITDTDTGTATFHDGASDLPTAHGQVLAQPLILSSPVTIWNGIAGSTGTVTIPAGSPIPAGTRIEMEFEVNTTTGETFYYIRVGAGPGTGQNNLGTNIGVAGTTVDPLVPGTTYTIDTSGDLSGVPYAAFCFAEETQVDTPEGFKSIVELEEGDLVTTLDHGSQPIRWIGKRVVSLVEMMANPALRPILFEAGSIGNDRDLIVSPQHRMLLNDWRAQVYFGEDVVLIAAKALVNGKTIRQIVPEDGVTYCHLLFDQHEILIAEGALSESFHPGAAGVDALSGDQQRELELMFPELAYGLPIRETAYPVVKPADVRGLDLTN